MSKIFIYGAPGVGKTTYSEHLKDEFNFPLVEADYLREVIAQKEKAVDDDPFLYVGTKEAWQMFGELNEDNVVKGLNSVRKSMEPYVEREITKYRDLILEGAFLNPKLLIKLGKLILVTVLDEKTHEQQFFAHRERTSENVQSFKAVRIIQEYLIKESKNLDVEIVENKTN